MRTFFSFAYLLNDSTDSCFELKRTWDSFAVCYISI